ncbi:murein transglycosylase [Anditalea andensis]|uniref:Murein transglycosylase n=1 Tax=Anditalea andensis TaxID=1048983 RepID=A0A074KX16_9BACT|nr:murein transglycosylase [Anditalea andensis]
MQQYHIPILYVLILLLGGTVVYINLIKEAPIQEVVFVNDSSGEQTTITIPEFTRVKLFDLPEGINFAGEPVPFDQDDIIERFEREIYVNAYWNSNTIMIMKRAAKFMPIIEPILAKHGIPEDFKYVALVESGLMNVVSPAGARGFWQFMDNTAKELKLEVSTEVDERYHLEKATEAACQYLKKAYARFGNWTSVAASYNMGITGLTKRKNEQQVPKYYDLLLNEETSRYIFRILAFKELFENPKTYGYELEKEQLYTMPKLKVIKVDSNINDLAAWSLKNNSNYKELKLYNPWLRSNKLTIKKGTSYEIKLPA